ncbi:hypothetical protein BGZ60DRAFT_520552 [Tricladium varicosporioides]|nr:hypothetical protein BGZ60DRAFT_520552 [Hymenoscyphus varicosporioides]
MGNLPGRTPDNTPYLRIAEKIRTKGCGPKRHKKDISRITQWSWLELGMIEKQQSVDRVDDAVHRKQYDQLPLQATYSGNETAQAFAVSAVIVSDWDGAKGSGGVTQRLKPMGHYRQVASDVLKEPQDDRKLPKGIQSKLKGIIEYEEKRLNSKESLGLECLADLKVSGQASTGLTESLVRILCGPDYHARSSLTSFD